MIRGIYTAAGAMAAQMAKQEVLANNLANLNTSGFKEDLAIYKTRADKTIYRVEAQGGARSGAAAVEKMGELSTGVYLDQIATRMEVGQMRATDEPLDLALSDKGFFVVREENGEEFLTRGGSFRRDKNGNVVDNAGRALLSDQGPVRLTGRGALHIDKDGRVTEGAQIQGTLRTVDADQVSTALEKLGGSLWRIKDPTAIRPTKSEVLQGFLESSNVNPMREMAEMIEAQRTYEASQHMITAQDETIAKAVNDLGRV